MSARTPEETHALIAAAFNAGDVDALVEIYEEDAMLIVPPDGQRVTGRDAIRAAVQPTFALRPSASIDVVQKLQTDGLALTQARWSLVGSDDGERVEMSGRGAIVSRRQPDGSWRIVLDNPLSPEEDR
jgi:uncharacterized protein (TIGR02246 family)